MTPEAVEIFVQHCQQDLATNIEILNYWTNVRGLTQATIQQWGLGAFTPAAANLAKLWSELMEFDDDDIYPILRVRDGGFESDFFNNRAIIPIHDQYGKLIAFSGRALASEQQQKQHNIVKYRNTPYSKASQLFGLHAAIPTVLRTGEIILCEGNLDVITAHQNGIKNVVGVGSANVSPAQLALAARYAQRVFIALDADEAGEEGAARIKTKSATLAAELGIEIQFMQISGAKDIDAMLQKERKW